MVHKITIFAYLTHSAQIIYITNDLNISDSSNIIALTVANFVIYTFIVSIRCVKIAHRNDSHYSVQIANYISQNIYYTQRIYNSMILLFLRKYVKNVAQYTMYLIINW